MNERLARAASDAAAQALGAPVLVVRVPTTWLREAAVGSASSSVTAGRSLSPTMPLRSPAIDAGTTGARRFANARCPSARRTSSSGARSAVAIVAAVATTWIVSRLSEMPVTASPSDRSHPSTLASSAPEAPKRRANAPRARNRWNWAVCGV